MAYFPKKNEQEEQIAGMNTLGPTAEGIQQGGDQPDQQKAPSSTSSTTSATTPSSAPSTRSSGAKSGSGAPNIGKYIQANKPAAQRLAKDVTEHFSKEATKTGEAVKQQETDFMRRVAQNRAGVQQAQRTATGVAEKAAGLGAGEQLSQDEIKSFKQAQEIKPMNTIDLSEQQSQADRLTKQADEIRSGLNRGTLLKETFNQNRPYTRGQSVLDDVILSGDPTLKAGILQDVRQQAGDIQSNLTGARQSAIRELGGLQQESRTGATGLRDLLTGEGGYIPTLQHDIETLRGQKQADLEGLSGQGVSLEDTRQLLGNLGIDDYQYMYGVDPTQFIPEVSAGQVATAEQLARAQALSQLSGTAPLVSEVGLDNPQVEQLRQALTAGKSAYESAYNPQYQAVNSLIDALNHGIPDYLRTDFRNIGEYYDHQMREIPKSGYRSSTDETPEQKLQHIIRSIPETERMLNNALFAVPGFKPSTVKTNAYNRAMDAARQIRNLNKQYGISDFEDENPWIRALLG